MSRLRIGQGVDVHRFREGTALKLCGLLLPCEPGLEGHSDADVALHAVTDAVLGALGRGDLGEHFPACDPKWRGAESRVFAARALELAAADGFDVVNCDLTIVGDRPAIAPHRNRLRRSLAEILCLPESAVSIKATTSEGLGFAGRGEGLAALAVVLLERTPGDG